MLKIGVGTKNPAKLEAVKSAFSTMGYDIELIGIDVTSGVAAQPFSDDETITGAINRAKSVMEHPDSHFDFAIGLEGGVVDTKFGLFLCNWGAVVSASGELGIGGGHRVQLPSVLSLELYQGKELGDVVDLWAGGQEIKKKEGTIGILTRNHITRKKMFHDVVICSFSKFLI
jgi:inosine/xanthosine triphosphatase